MSSINRLIRTKPFLRLSLFQVLGIVLAYCAQLVGLAYIFQSQTQFLLLFSLLLLFGLSFWIGYLRSNPWFAKRWVNGGAISVWMLALGYLLCSFNLFLNQQKIDFPYTTLTLERPVFLIESGPIEWYESYRYEVDWLKPSTEYEQAGTGGILIANQSYCPGDTVVVNGYFQELHRPGNPTPVDFAKIYQNKGLYFEYIAESSEVVAYGSFSIQNPVYWRSQLAALFESELNAESSGLIKAMLLGDKSSLDRDLRQAYSASGAMHVLAVSGLHVGLIFLVLAKVLQVLFRERFKGVQAALSILGIQFYALLTGFVPSVFRASSMISLYVLGKHIQRRTDVINIITATAFIMLLIDPLQLFQVSFQLSFSALLGLVLLFPKIRAWWSPKYRLVAYFWDLTCLSLAAQLATFPLGLYYFHQFPTWFLLANWVVVPAAFLLLTGSLVLLIMIPLGLGKYGAWVMEPFIHGVNTLVRWIEGIPPGAIGGVFIGAMGCVLLYSLLIFIYLGVIRKHQRWFFAAGCCAFILLGMGISQSWIEGQRQGILVYRHQVPIIEVYSGNQSVVISAEKDSVKLARIRRGWEQMKRIDSVVVLTPDAYWSNEYVRVDGGVMQLLDEVWVLEQKEGAEVLQGVDWVVVPGWSLSREELIPDLKYMVYGKVDSGQKENDERIYILNQNGYLLLEK